MPLYNPSSGSGGALGGVKANRSTTQAYTASAFVPVTFDTQEFSFGGFTWSSGAPTRLTVPSGAGGVMEIKSTVLWDQVSAGTYRFTGIRLNGTTYLATDAEGGVAADFAATNCAQSPSCDKSLSAGDYIELLISSDANTNVLALLGSASLSMIRQS